MQEPGVSSIVSVRLRGGAVLDENPSDAKTSSIPDISPERSADSGHVASDVVDRADQGDEDHIDADGAPDASGDGETSDDGSDRASAPA
jgi:hypothetical protein